MKFELVRLERENHEPLRGICAKNETDRGLLLFVHGLSGNFYENDLIEVTLKVFYDAGFSVATVNFPGFDSAHKTENHRDFTPALNQWINELGFEENIILQGHSLGSLKVLSYESDPRAKYVQNVRAVSLLAPFDDVAVWGSVDKAEQRRRLDLMTRIVKESGPATIVNEDWMYWPMSAGLMVEKLTPGSLLDQVATREGIPTLAWPNIPKFTAAGEDDIYLLPSPQETIELLSKHPNMSAHIIPHCDHGFNQNLPGLQAELKEWIDSVV